MQRTLLVFKNELIGTVWRKSFMLTLFLFPLLTFAIITIVNALSPGQSSNPINAIINSDAQKTGMGGYIDPSGLIKQLPPWIKANSLQVYSSESQAAADLAGGRIDTYFIIPADYLQTGRVIAVRANLSPTADQELSQALRDTLRYNLLNGDEQLAKRLGQVMVTETRYLSNQPPRDPTSSLTFYLPYGVTLIFFTVIMGSASLMLNSITIEKQNRVMEILLTSIKPQQMLLGKIIAMGVAGLIQTLVWTGAGYGLLMLRGSALALPADFILPPSILFWGVLFFLLGYGLYASLMAGIGALVPSLREASQVTTVVIIPLIAPLMVMSLIIRDPNGTLAVVLSFIPLTAPVMVMMRLAIGSVPVWQILLAAGLLLASTILLVRFVSGLFRAQNLLSGQSFRWTLFLKALVGRA